MGSKRWNGIESIRENDSVRPSPRSRSSRGRPSAGCCDDVATETCVPPKWRTIECKYPSIFRLKLWGFGPWSHPSFSAGTGKKTTPFGETWSTIMKSLRPTNFAVYGQQTSLSLHFQSQKDDSFSGTKACRPFVDTSPQRVGRLDIDGACRDTFRGRQGTPAISVFDCYCYCTKGNIHNFIPYGKAMSILWSFPFRQWSEGVSVATKRGSVL